MIVIEIIFLIAGAATCLFFGIIVYSSYRERKFRALAIGAVLLVAAALFIFGGIFLTDLPFYVMLGYILTFLIVLLLYFLPIGKIKSISINGISERVDERDVIFAREEYKPGTDRYNQYYTMHPDKKAIDDKLRSLPELLEPGGRYYDPIGSKMVDNIFSVIESMSNDVDGPVNDHRLDIDSEVMTGSIKELVIGLGGDEVGIALLNPIYIYSHVGRGPEEWGKPIENDHKYAVAFTLEMDYNHVEAAPKLPLTEESALQYLRGAGISIALARYIRQLGYPARAHIAGSNYQIMLPPVAHDAGLGELGRLGYLVSPRFGARIRLGAVTTDLPLIADKPIRFGVQNFCEQCMKCAVNCPSGAIPHGNKINIRGVEKSQLNIEQCLYYWRVAGTDCGLCMKVCPYSHPPTLMHNLVRAGIKRSAFARKISVWGDDIFYGRRAKWD